jgi:methionine-S-sulfoxide reductase
MFIVFPRALKKYFNYPAIFIFLIFCFAWNHSYSHEQVKTQNNTQNKHPKIATFAGGSFWSMQPLFDAIKGVEKTVVGYAGGKEANPTYEDVSLGETSHVEAIQVTYDPNIISYQALLDVYWQNIDPTDDKGQFCDKGSQFRTVIFYNDETQKELALDSKRQLLANHKFKQFDTQIRPYINFTPAEEDHQEYYKKNRVRYKFYNITCGRDQGLKAIWSKK